MQRLEALLRRRAIAQDVFDALGNGLDRVEARRLPRHLDRAAVNDGAGLDARVERVDDGQAVDEEKILVDSR